MQCEICGKEAELFEANIDGVELLLCERCGGKKNPEPKQFFYKEKRKEKLKELCEDYGRRISQARSKRSLSRSELAKKLFIAESFLAKIEAQKLEPDDKTAKKLEKFLGISLFEDE